MPSPDAPLQGSCACGTVRFQVTAPFRSAGYCHCKRCQRRTGTLSSFNAEVGADGFAVLAGEEALRTWGPPDGRSKTFCVHCGGHVYSGDRSEGGAVGVRLGAVDGDPGIEPSYRQWLESAPDWAPVPEDGLARFARSRQAG